MKRTFVCDFCNADNTTENERLYIEKDARIICSECVTAIVLLLIDKAVAAIPPDQEP